MMTEQQISDMLSIAYRVLGEDSPSTTRRTWVVDAIASIERHDIEAARRIGMIADGVQAKNVAVVNQ
jgi:hypothetical protein